VSDTVRFIAGMSGSLLTKASSVPLGLRAMFLILRFRAAYRSVRP
jgi:hypothetical protein